MVIIFDVDGTVLDTYEHIRHTYMDVFAKMLPNYHYTEEELQSFFGPPLPDTFNSIVHDEELTKKLVQEYRKMSKKNLQKYLKVYPHTFEVLEALRKGGFTLTILSNKVHEAIIEGFNAVGLLPYFDLILGYDDVQNPKPHPEGVYYIQERYHDECILVGDSIFDIATAKNAGIKAVGVTWALTTKRQLLEAGADVVIDDFLELLKIIKEL